jgi:hypothetical protein
MGDDARLIGVRARNGSNGMGMEASLGFFDSAPRRSAQNDDFVGAENALGADMPIQSVYVQTPFSTR